MPARRLEILLGIVAQCVALGGLKKSPIPDWWKDRKAPLDPDQVRDVMGRADAARAASEGRRR